MNYVRVIPRDLFNEAGLLKCYGKLAILIENNPGGAEFNVEQVSRFLIEQNPADGSISITNVRLVVRGEEVGLFRPLNSRDSWGLWLHDERLDDDVEVFTEDGGLTPEMLAYLTGEQG